MQKPVFTFLAALPLLAMSGDALAHPGPHGDMGVWTMLEHFLSSPFHVGMVAIVAVLLAVGVIWSTAKRGR